MTMAFPRLTRRAALAARAAAKTSFQLALNSTAAQGDEVPNGVSRIAANMTGGLVEDCGHFIPEEKPVELANRLREHFQRA